MVLDDDVKQLEQDLGLQLLVEQVEQSAALFIESVVNRRSLQGLGSVGAFL